MPAITPLPSAPPVPPVPVPAPLRSPFLYLVTDLWIATSWLLLIGTGLIFVLLFLLFQHSTPPSAFKIFAIFLVPGYIVWSLYFGLAACWRLTISVLRGSASMWIGVVLSVVLPPGWVLYVCAFLYACLGGGIYQFARRWWLLAHGQQPPFLTASRRVSYY